MEENREKITYEDLAQQISDLVAECSETNDRILELHEYLILKDEEEDKKAQEEKKALAEENAKKEERALAESNTKALEIETYGDYMKDIRAEVDVTNQLQGGIIFFMGVIFGLLFLKILWERITK